MEIVTTLFRAKLNIGKYAVEHFIPNAFVAHDLIWNLIPANPVFNSSKSDKLPSLDIYFDPFFDLQDQAITIIKHVAPKHRCLEDYYPINVWAKRTSIRDSHVPVGHRL